MGFIEDLKERILILDGAMGTMLQQGYTEEETLEAYVEAGADIITVNSFDLNRLGMSGAEAPALAYAAARRARAVADRAGRKVYVAGSVSPTGKSLTLPYDAADPSKRPYSFDELKDSFKEQIEAVVKGGADIILLETNFDALNTKAEIRAIEELGSPVPVIISATVSDRSGRTLTGQTLEAFYTAVKHCPRLAAFGINCALGASAMADLVREIAAFSSHPVIFYPNAGIPDEMGRYKDSPENMAKVISGLASEGLLNIAGGCCGTTPAHIKALSEALRAIKPRITRLAETRLEVSGLEAVTISPEKNFTNIGERTNVAGSKKFARLIASSSYAEALDVALKQIEGGADIIDINMDDPMVDSSEKMRTFLRHISGEPAIAKAAVMIDSSHWDTIVEGLKNVQGKPIVNSISLKEGEEEFLCKARFISDMGGAMVVMAFDEVGQATTFARKTEICARSYKLLTEAGIAPEDIIFDCNILSIGTGIQEHSRFGIDFIEAVRWIKENLKGAKTSGGVSNLSFAFRGNNAVREAMHSAFLYHAIKAGLDMAIVNPQMLQIYDSIEPELKKAVEDVIFDSDPEATARLLDIAARAMETAKEASGSEPEDARAKMAVTERLTDSLVRGISNGLEPDVLAALALLGSPVAVIEGPLMDGMAKVGEMFADGRMFLPQVVKSASIMRDAVAVLRPYMTGSEEASYKPKFVIATVQGDVHDIGKNITSIVLQCSGFEVIDLGVMVPADDIIDRAVSENADMIGLSGLITPSLSRMEEVARKMSERGMTIPLFVGGAAVTSLFTAVRLAPLYANVHYGADASATAVNAKRYLSDKEGFIEAENACFKKIRECYESGLDKGPKEKKIAVDGNGYLKENIFEDIELRKINASHLMPWFDWRMFSMVCGIKDLDEGTKSKVTSSAHNLEAVISARFDSFRREADGTLVGAATGLSLPMLRPEASLARFFPSDDECLAGFFSLKIEGSDGDLDPLTLHSLKVTLAEAASTMLARKLSEKLPEGYKLINPGVGYACLPDHSLKRDILSRLPGIGIGLTDSCAMIPEASVCGLIIVHKDAAYLDLRGLSEREKDEYAAKRGFTEEEKKLFLGAL